MDRLGALLKHHVTGAIERGEGVAITERLPVKSIGYAYASSTYAARLGASSTGCYYVQTKASETATRALSLRGPFATIEDAEAFAADITGDWSRFTRRAPLGRSAAA